MTMERDELVKLLRGARDDYQKVRENEYSIYCNLILAIEDFEAALASAEAQEPAVDLVADSYRRGYNECAARYQVLEAQFKLLSERVVEIAALQPAKPILMAQPPEENVRAEPYAWVCGCGHPNGLNLSDCAACGRQPGNQRTVGEPFNPTEILYRAAPSPHPSTAEAVARVDLTRPGCIEWLVPPTDGEHGVAGWVAEDRGNLYAHPPKAAIDPADAAEENAAMLILSTVLDEAERDEFLAWYKPQEWLGIHRAVASFILTKRPKAEAASETASCSHVRMGDQRKVLLFMCHDCIERVKECYTRPPKAETAQEAVAIKAIVWALEGSAANTDTDPRWVAASELRRLDGWESRSLTIAHQ